MAGLFDFLNDPNQAASNALMFGLLGGRGNLGGILGRSGMAAMAAGNQAQNDLTKRNLLNAQIKDMAAQEELRRQQAARMTQGLDLLSSVLSRQPTTSQYGVGGSGINLGGVSEPMAPQRGGLAAATPEEIGLLKGYGYDLVDLYNKAQFGEQMQPGYRRGYNGQLQYMPDPSKSLDYNPDTKQVSLLPGAADAQAKLASATKEAEARATGKYDLVSGLGPNNAPSLIGTRTSIADRLNGVTADLPPSGKTNTYGSDTLAILQNELKNATDPADVAAIQRQIARVTSAMQQGGAIKTGLSPEEQAAQAATTDYLKGRAGSQAKDMESIQTRGFAAPQKIATLDQIGKLYDNYEGGTLSGFALKAASTANSLGFKIDPKLGDKQAAEALSKEMALSLRNTSQGGGMPGSMSDQDRNYLKSMVPDLAQSAAGRQKIINAHRALLQRDIQVAEFARNYENKYGKLDNGFYNQLQQWANDNPLFK